jgi:hypothetical protein
MKCGGKVFVLSSVVLLYGLATLFIQPVRGKELQAAFCEKLKPCQLLSQAEAEKILGQPVRPGRDTSRLKGDIRQCGCAYTGIASDPLSGQEINLYFSFEQKETGPTADQARQVMASTRIENAHDATISELSGIGDEAFLIGDVPNIHFIMARKGAVVIRLQVKQATEKSSLEALRNFAGAAARRL